MGLTYATIEVSNGYDILKSEDGFISENEIRRWSGEMLVDSGAIRMAINEEIKQKLGLKNGMITPVTLANGDVVKIELIGNLVVRFGNRKCYTDAFVLPGNTEPLLGAIPMEGMDLAIIPSESKLDYNPNHPDGALFSLK
jgi:clan AA aspartic protease